MHQLVDQHVEALVVVIEARKATGVARIERSDVYGEVFEQLAFVGAEEVIGPSDRLGHAPMTGGAAESRPIEHISAVTQAVGDLGRAQGARSRGGDLERQGQPVEASAQIDDGIEIRSIDVHARIAGAFEEQLDRGPRQRIECVDGRHLERCQGHDRLAGQLERRSARGEHCRLLADLEDAADRAGRSLDQVLAVVDEEQRLSIAGRVEQGLERLVAELGGEGAGDGIGIVHAREVDHS